MVKLTSWAAIDALDGAVAEEALKASWAGWAVWLRGGGQNAALQK